MTVDVSRDTFDPSKAYSAVRMQQGRLFSDADWNEQGDIARHAERASTRAMIGPSGFPEDDAGFAVMLGAGDGALLIGPGTGYIDGIRIENASGPQIQLLRKSGAAENTLWQVTAGTRVKIGEYLVLDGQGLDQAVRVSELSADVEGLEVFKCAAALSTDDAVTVTRYYSVESQPNFPELALPDADETYLIYLDVWDRQIGAIEDPGIREPAFGGPDTAARDKTLWQARIVSIPDLVAAGAATVPVTCKSFGPLWTPFGPFTQGRLAARAAVTVMGGDPCVLPASGGYRSLDNHLYRVHVHRGGEIEAGGIAIKWSRDNAIHRSAYSHIDSGKIVVDTLGPDEATSLQRNDWIEILDEGRALASQGGFFGRISDVNGTSLTLDKLLDPNTLLELTDNGEPDVAVLPSSGLVRRWEGGPPAVFADHDWIPLDAGIEVQFDAGRFFAGDYWTIPARSLTANLDWPPDPATGAPASLPPDGVTHHYSALGLATLAAGAWTVVDCRPLFAPLTLQRAFLYLGGDGQEAMPLPANTAQPTPLPAPLRVGVVRGKTPVAGAIVEYRVFAGTGVLGNPADNLATRQVLTDADGIAKMSWALSSQDQVQQVEARLLDSAGHQTHLPIHFTATLSRAAEVSYDPANTPALAGANTVQEAIDQLAKLTASGCSTYVVTEGSDWVKLLKSIKPNEHAAVCFQRGSYLASETVVLSGLGHLTLHGAGQGTTISVKSGECALQLRDCASVTVRDLEITAPDAGAQPWQPGIRPGRRGALTINDCPDVDIADCALLCGGEAQTERTCITVRGTPTTPLRSVRILRNRLTVGYLQDGILVTDCERCCIWGNELLVAPKPASLSKQKLLTGGFWRTKLIDRIVAQPKEIGLGSGKGDKSIAAGDFVATFDSTVPQGEWTKLVHDDPPPSEALKQLPAFQGYVGGLLDKVAQEPQRLPTLARTVSKLEADSPPGTRLAANVKRALAISGAVDFSARADGEEGWVTLAAGDYRIAFRSVTSEAEWRNAMALMPPKRSESAKALMAHARNIASRALADVPFRQKLPGLNGWIDDFAAALPSFARQGVTCAGAKLNDLTISDNRIRGFAQGVHVAASQASDETVSAVRVSVRDNHLSCRKAATDAYAPCALFVGNVESAWIERNLIDWAGAPDTLPYPQGIRVWGRLGHFLMINENRIGLATLGIRVRSVLRIDDSLWGGYRWLAADNLVYGPANVIALRGPPWLEDRHNRPSVS